MKEFFVDVARYKPIGSCREAVFSLNKMIKDGLFEYLVSKGIDFELLNSRIELEAEDEKLQKDFMEICLHNPIDCQRLEEIKQRQGVLYNSRKQGFYNGEKCYNNDEIKNIEKKIWYRGFNNEFSCNRKKVAEKME